MHTSRGFWIDCCCSPKHNNLFRIVANRTDARRVKWPAVALPSIREHNPGFVCVEYDYPDQARLRAIPLVRASFPALPVLMLTEYHSEALAVWAFRHRVWDYRVKPVTEEVLLRLIRELTDLEHAAQQYRWFANGIAPNLIAPSGHLRKPLMAAPRTSQAIAYVSEHYPEAVRIETVARLCRLSESEFSRTFHREHNVSFRRFLLNYRIAMARDFLAEPRTSVSEVAFAVGFNDLSQFGRMFRRLVGEPATRYQRRVHPAAQAPKNEDPNDRAEKFHPGAD